MSIKKGRLQYGPLLVRGMISYILVPDLKESYEQNTGAARSFFVFPSCNTVDALGDPQ